MSLSIRTYRDFLANGLVVQLHNDGHIVQDVIPDEELEDAHHPSVLFEGYLWRLAGRWLEEFGREVRVIRPTREAEAFRAEFVDEVIDGEIVDKELLPGERRAIGA